jgi:hypothetical protein
MNTSLTRTQFIDRVVSQDDLQWVAIMLADWYRQTRGHLPSMSVALHLWGCPAQEEREMMQRVQERAASQGVPLSGIPLTPPPGALAPAIGSLMALFHDPALDWMAAEIRLTLCDAHPRTLVLYGSVQGGAFLLKALWSVGAGELKEEAYASAAWPNEAQFMTALSAYQNGDRVVPQWGRLALFPPPGHLSWLSALAWFLAPQDKSGVRGFLLRVAVAGALFVVCLWGVLAFSASNPRLLFPVNLGLALAGLGLVYTLGLKSMLIYKALTQMRASLSAAYARPIAYPEIDLAAIPGALQDPTLRKLSAEIAALGGRHYKDIQVQPEVSGQFWIRLYLFPEDATVFTAMFMHRSGKFYVVPSKATFLLRTNLSDGYRLVSTSGGSGYRKPLSALPVISRTFPGVCDPAEMLQKHRAVLAQIEQAGRTRVPIAPEHLIAQMVAEHEQIGAELAKYGYFQWDDAVRMAFHLPRPEYRT